MTSDAPGWFRAALETPVDEGAVEIRGASIAYRAWGEAGAPGVVLVHGGAAHGRWWDHVGPLLVEGARRIVAIDLSGHGDSGHRDSYDFGTWAAETLAVAESAGIGGPPTVIGHSMGGFVTLQAAITSGDRIAGAIVVDSPLRELTPEEVAARAGIAFGPLRVHASLAEGLARFHPIPNQPVLDYVAAHVAAHSLRPVDGGWVWKFDPRIFGGSPLAPSSITPLDLRVALVRGERGILTRQMSLNVHDKLGRAVPVVEIPDAGHHIMLDQPLSLVAALRTFLGEWATPSR
jgi:pimeloyl-ACP methyl ester carboxylesterase